MVHSCARFEMPGLNVGSITIQRAQSGGRFCRSPPPISSFITYGSHQFPRAGPALGLYDDHGCMPAPALPHKLQQPMLCPAGARRKRKRLSKAGAGPAHAEAPATRWACRRSRASYASSNMSLQLTLALSLMQERKAPLSLRCSV